MAIRVKSVPVSFLGIISADEAGFLYLCRSYGQHHPSRSHAGSAEQIGFLSPGDADCDIALQMAGGEFCGNAAMSAAAVYALCSGLNSADVHVRVSGAPDPIVVQIRTADEQAHVYIGTVEMPSSVSMEDLNVPLAHGMLPVTAVRLPGIVHLITDTPVEKECAEEAIRQWCSLFQADALGLILLNRQNETLTPLVYVRRSNTLFWESSCASGTTAAGAVLRNIFGPGSWTFSEFSALDPGPFRNQPAN